MPLGEYLVPRGKQQQPFLRCCVPQVSDHSCYLLPHCLQDSPAGEVLLLHMKARLLLISCDIIFLLNVLHGYFSLYFGINLPSVSDMHKAQIIYHRATIWPVTPPSAFLLLTIPKSGT